MTETYLERLISETLRPVYKALDLLRLEISESMNIPDSPWKILNKPYRDLTEPELFALMDIYHTPGESKPCPFCSWITREELMLARKDKREFGV